MTPNETAMLAKALAATAKTAGKALDDFAMGVYVKRLDRFALGRVLPLLEAGVETARLPTVRELVNALDGVLDDKDEAQDTSDRIVAAIPRFGTYRSTEAMASIGPVGAEVVRRFGGWGQVCDVTNEGLNTLRAQLRESARSVLARAKAGRLDQPAQLPSPQGQAPGLTSAGSVLAGLLPSSR